MYAVKEIFYTLQGEGAQSGRAAVFLRFAGCNLWTGREQDRETAVCRFCDTDFVGTDGPGGGQFAEPRALADAVAALWPDGCRTGRKALCRLHGRRAAAPARRAALIEALHARGFEIAIETNGTLRRARRHRLDLRQPEGQGAAGAALRRRIEAGFSARRPPARRARRTGLPAFLPAADGRAGSCGKSRANRSLLPRASALAFIDANT